MANCVYTFTSPSGEKFENVENLASFCREHNLNKKRMSSERKNKGWTVDYIPKAKTIHKEMKKSGLSTEERLLRITDENTKLKTQIKEATRDNSLFKELSEVIREVPAFDYVPELKISKKTGKIEESVVMVLSDLHGDQTIKSERVNGMEEFNFNVFCRRAEKLVDTTIKHLTQNLVGYNFSTLYIFSLGDNVNGLIHNSQEHSEWNNTIRSSMAVGSVIAKMISDLSPHFEKIVYIGISGNHPRLNTGKKDFRGALNNFDYLVNSFAKAKVENLIASGRVEFEIPDSWSSVVKIYDTNIHISHGDTLSSGSLGIPFYSLQRRSYRLTTLGTMTGEVPHVQICGHYHTASSLTQTGSELFVNGSFPACDEFSFHALSAYSEPSQLLMGVHPIHKISWRMPIKLRTENWRVDEKKKSRYNVDLF